MRLPVLTYMPRADRAEPAGAFRIRRLSLADSARAIGPSTYASLASILSFVNAVIVWP